MRSRYTIEQRRELVAQAEAAQTRGLSYRAFCKKRGLSQGMLSRWRLQSNRPRAVVAVTAMVEAPRAPYVMPAEAFTSPGSFMVLLATVARQAVDDMAFGLARGWINDELVFTEQGHASRGGRSMPEPRESGEALDFILSEEAEILCALINKCLGNERLSADYLLHRAKALSERYANDGASNKGMWRSGRPGETVYKRSKTGRRLRRASRQELLCA